MFTVYEMFIILQRDYICYIYICATIVHLYVLDVLASLMYLYMDYETIVNNGISHILVNHYILFLTVIPEFSEQR